MSITRNTWWRCAFLLLVIMLAQSCSSGPIPVVVESTADGHRLLRGGQPYTVKGAGLEAQSMGSLAAYGGNSFRTWHVEEDVAAGLAMLDQAHALGLTVTLCLNIARERHGFDYDSPAAVRAQLEKARSAVVAYRDHPALLAWLIGNELNYDYSNPAVYDAVNQMSLMIHGLDPNHPTTTSIAGYSGDVVRVIGERAPDLDFLSIQMYADLINLPRYIRETGFERPYFVTEWGAVGHWEVGKTAWGAPVEQNSSEKAANYLKSYEQVIATLPHQGIGNYVFLWGQKQERTPTWYGLFTETGEATEAVDVMHYIWNDRWPDNRSPQVQHLTLDGRTAFDNIKVGPGIAFEASVGLNDPEGDALTFAWSVKPESDSVEHGGDFEAPIEDVGTLIEHPNASSTVIHAPKAPGAYRVFVYAYDGQGNAAHGNIPFLVEDTK